MKSMRRALKIINRLDHKVVVTMGGEDRTFPLSTDVRHKPNPEAFRTLAQKLYNHPKVLKMYVENLDLSHPKLAPMPLGYNYTHGMTIQWFMKQFPVTRFEMKNLRVSSFNRVRRHPQFRERVRVNNYCKGAWAKCVGFRGNTKENYLKKLAKWPFTLCVTGGGSDPCPKLYEALLVGVIPIIKRAPPLTHAFDNLPVVQVKSWGPNTITKAKLKRWYKKLRPYFLNPEVRLQILHRLTLDFWKKKFDDEFANN